MRGGAIAASVLHGLQQLRRHAPEFAPCCAIAWSVRASWPFGAGWDCWACGGPELGAAGGCLGWIVPGRSATFQARWLPLLRAWNVAGEPRPACAPHGGRGGPEFLLYIFGLPEDGMESWPLLECKGVFVSLKRPGCPARGARFYQSAGGFVQECGFLDKTGRGLNSCSRILDSARAGLLSVGFPENKGDQVVSGVREFGPIGGRGLGGPGDISRQLSGNVRQGGGILGGVSGAGWIR